MRLSVFAGSIRRALIALVLVSLLPALAIILYTGMEARRHALDEARASALLLARSVGEIQQRTIQGIRQLLLVLSLSPAARREQTVSGGFMKDILESTPILSNVFVADRAGNTLLSPFPDPQPFMGDRPYFKKALRDNAFTAGEFMIGRFSGLPVLPFAAPIPGPGGEPIGVVGVGVRLDAPYADIFRETPFPPGAVLTLTDRKGVRLFRYPQNPAAVLGRPISDDFELLTAGPSDQGTFVRNGADGVRRIYAFTRLRLAPDAEPYMHIIVGIPEDHSLGEANALLYRNLELMAAATLLALASAWYLGKLMLGRRLSRLAAIAEKVGNGDLSQHVPTECARGELGRLEHSVNAMIEALVRDARARAIYEEALQEAYEELEQRVEDRTRDLREANDRLLAEAEERAQVEEALRQSEHRFRVLYEQSSVGIFVMDTQGVIQDANPDALALLGYSREEMKGLRYRNIIRPDCLAAQPFDMEGILAGKTLTAERIFMTRDGRSIPVDVSGRLVGGNMFQAVFKDATERKKLEQLRDDVERITRHDLKTPLMGMVHVPTMLLKSDNLTDKQRELLEVVRDSAYRMLQTINMSLALYRMESGTYECDSKPFDILHILRKVEEETKAYAQSRGVELEILLGGAPAGPEDSFTVAGEELLCLTMLENLVKNALEASPDNRTVTVDIDVAGRSLTIRNKGEVPQSIRENFFEKYSTSGKKWGTGLGTYSARLIAVTHGWDIRLDTSLAGETSIALLFPARDA